MNFKGIAILAIGGYIIYVYSDEIFKTKKEDTITTDPIETHPKKKKLNPKEPHPDDPIIFPHEDPMTDPIFF